MDAQELREQAEDLVRAAERLEAGEELCKHHWSGDPAWECYCTGCGCHIAEARSESDIPFKSDAYCHECTKTPAQKEAERREEENAERDHELKLLAKLQAKYPTA